MTPPSQTAAPSLRRSTPPLRSAKFPLSASERWAIIGKTGSGKTEFTKYLTRTFVRAGWPLVIIDPKGNYVDTEEPGHHFARVRERATVDHPWRIEEGVDWRAPVQLYIPHLGATDPVFSEILYSCLRRGGVVIHIDDLVGLADEHSMPPALASCWSLGRSLKVPMFVLGARPREVPRLMFVQSENLVLFRMPDEEDRLRASKLVGDRRILEPLPKYYFWYKHEDMDSASRFAPLSLYEMKPMPEQEGR